MPVLVTSGVVPLHVGTAGPVPVGVVTGALFGRVVRLLAAGPTSLPVIPAVGVTTGRWPAPEVRRPLDPGRQDHGRLLGPAPDRDLDEGVGRWLPSPLPDRLLGWWGGLVTPSARTAVAS